MPLTERHKNHSAAVSGTLNEGGRCSADRVSPGVGSHPGPGRYTQQPELLLTSADMGPRWYQAVPHGYSDITGGVYSLHLCTDPNGSEECHSRVITTGNLEDVRNVSAKTVNVSGPARYKFCRSSTEAA
eukprot:366956-Rhodomonas_salina.4